ncbi:MAG: ATP-binding protein [Acetobacterium sp.]
MEKIKINPISSTTPLQLVFFREINNTPLVQCFSKILSESEKSPDNKPSSELIKAYFHLKSILIQDSMKPENALVKNPAGQSLWQSFLLENILNDENALTMFCESQLMETTHHFYHSMLQDVTILLQILNFRWDVFLETYAIDSENIFSKEIFSLNSENAPLVEAIQKNDAIVFLHALNQYIYKNGLGIFLNNGSFKVNALGQLVPITKENTQTMDDLIGNNHQKKEIIDNTQALIDYRQGLNVLLQGSMGTGKSSTVLALLHTFRNTRLKIIEIKRDQLAYIPKLFKQLGDRSYPFILFIDDLTFETKDQEYKILKGVLEGSLEKNPNNIRIYATSNRRHLVEERFSEREDAVNAREVLEEKLSLSSRFGLVLTYSTPNQQEYLNIVHELAKSFGVTMDSTELESRAIMWERRHINTSGRTAEQLVHYLLVEQKRQEAV